MPAMLRLSMSMMLKPEAVSSSSWLSRKSIAVDGDHVAAARVDTGGGRDNLLHLGDVGVDLGLVGRLADHLWRCGPC